MFRHAIVRKPAPNFADGLTTAGLGAPIYEKALEQHERYCAALAECGLELTVLGPDAEYPDSTFVEPYVVSDDPRERVVGYLAYQIGPYMGVGSLWRKALEKEIDYAMSSNETRPMWQLLVCLALFGAVQTNDAPTIGASIPERENPVICTVPAGSPPVHVMS